MTEDSHLKFGDLAYWTHGHVLASRLGSVTLTNRQSGVMEQLMVARGVPMSRSALVTPMWGIHDDGPQDGIVPVLIYRLRVALKAAGSDTVIKMQYGVGYSLEHNGPQVTIRFFDQGQNEALIRVLALVRLTDPELADATGA